LAQAVGPKRANTLLDMQEKIDKLQNSRLYFKNNAHIQQKETAKLKKSQKSDLMQKDQEIKALKQTVEIKDDLLEKNNAQI